MIESDQGLRMAARVGVTDQMHSTSLGKAILSFLPPDDLDRLLARPLVQQTERTITDPEQLRAELETIRQVGFAEDYGENEVGARCFGAPIFDHRGRVVAAVSVASPQSRVDDERGLQISRAVRDAAAEITARLGGRWPIERDWSASPAEFDSDIEAQVAVPGAAGAGSGE
jgi:IclR family acetate operon transcriptional repressor